jgi:hypothetical protein
MSRTFRKYQENRFRDGGVKGSPNHGATSYTFRKIAKQTREMRQTKRRVPIEDLFDHE